MCRAASFRMPRLNRQGAVAVLAILSLLSTGSGAGGTPAFAAEPELSADPFSGPPLSEEELRARGIVFAQREADGRTITIRQVNLFHARFTDTVLGQDELRGLTCSYQGIVAVDRGRNKMRAVGVIGDPLGWGVYGGLGVFGFWISTQPTTETVGETTLEGQKLFINVDFVTENKGPDAPLRELGGLSVREAIVKLNSPWPLASRPANGDAPAAPNIVLDPPPRQVRERSLFRFGPPVTPRFVIELPPDVFRSNDQYQRDVNTMSARQANLFHLRFVETVMDDLPRLVALDYQGLVAADRARSRPPHGERIGWPLVWALSHDGAGVFGFWLSTQPTPQTAGSTSIEGQTFHMNVNFVTRNAGLETPLPELGDLSVREALAKLDKPWPRSGQSSAPLGQR